MARNIFAPSAAGSRRRRLLEGLLDEGMSHDNLPPGVTPFNPDEPDNPVRDLAMGELSAARPRPALPDLPPSSPSPEPMRAAGAPGSSPGPLTPNRPQNRFEEEQEAKDVYLKGTPSRRKSLLLGLARGALQGMASGGGIGGAVGGAVAGGAVGGISPRTLREQEFNERIAPRIQRRWQFEDQARAEARQAASDALDADYKRAQIGSLNRANQPQPQRAPSAQLRLGRNRRTGKLEYYNAADQQEAENHEPAEFPRDERQPGPHWVRDSSGSFVDLNAPANQGRKVRGYDRPRAPREPKAEKKYAAISDVREAVEAAQASGDNKMTESRMKAIFKAKGYEIVD